MNLSIQLTSFSHPPIQHGHPFQLVTLLSHQFLTLLESEPCILPVLLHIICHCDFNQGSIFSLDVLVTLLLDHQKQLRVLSWYGTSLSVPSSVGWLKIRSARSGQMLCLLSFVSASLFKRNQFPRQRKEINTIYWVGLLT